MAELPPQKVNELWHGVTDVNVLKQLCAERRISLDHSVQGYHDRLNEWDIDRINNDFITLGWGDPHDTEIIVRNGELSNASDAVKLEALQDWTKKMKAIGAARRQSEAESHAKFEERQDSYDEDMKEMIGIFESILGLKKKPNFRRLKTKMSVSGGADGIEPKEGSHLYYEPIRFFLGDVPSSIEFVKRSLARSAAEQQEQDINGVAREVSTTGIPTAVGEGPAPKKLKRKQE